MQQKYPTLFKIEPDIFISNFCCILVFVSFLNKTSKNFYFLIFINFLLHFAKSRVFILCKKFFAPVFLKKYFHKKYKKIVAFLKLLGFYILKSFVRCFSNKKATAINYSCSKQDYLFLIKRFIISKMDFLTSGGTSFALNVISSI